MYTGENLSWKATSSVSFASATFDPALIGSRTSCLSLAIVFSVMIDCCLLILSTRNAVACSLMAFRNVIPRNAWASLGVLAIVVSMAFVHCGACRSIASGITSHAPNIRPVRSATEWASPLLIVAPVTGSTIGPP